MVNVVRMYRPKPCDHITVSSCSGGVFARTVLRFAETERKSPDPFATNTAPTIALAPAVQRRKLHGDSPLHSSRHTTAGIQSNALAPVAPVIHAGRAGDPAPHCTVVSEDIAVIAA